jgi:hypothetical protein
VQPGEVRAAVGIAGHDLAVEHGDFGRQLKQLLRDGREPLGEVVPIAAEQDNARAYLVGLELDFVHPAVAGGHFLGADWAAGWDEAERGHASGCSDIAPAEQLAVALWFRPLLG